MTCPEMCGIDKHQRLHPWSLRMDKQFHPILYYGSKYFSMMELTLNHVTKGGHRYHGDEIYILINIEKWYRLCLLILHVLHDTSSYSMCKIFTFDTRIDLIFVQQNKLSRKMMTVPNGNISISVISNIYLSLYPYFLWRIESKVWCQSLIVSKVFWFLI